MVATARQVVLIGVAISTTLAGAFAPDSASLVLLLIGATCALASSLAMLWRSEATPKAEESNVWHLGAMDFADITDVHPGRPAHVEEDSAVDSAAATLAVSR